MKDLWGLVSGNYDSYRVRLLFSSHSAALAYLTAIEKAGEADDDYRLEAFTLMEEGDNPIWDTIWFASIKFDASDIAEMLVYQEHVLRWDQVAPSEELFLIRLKDKVVGHGTDKDAVIKEVTEYWNKEQPWKGSLK